MVSVRILGTADIAALDNVAPNVFDGAVRRELAAEFLADPRHHLAVAVSEAGQVVGMASAVHYVHPDKLPQLFVNEVSVSPAFHRQGLGKQLMAALLARGRELGSGWPPSRTTWRLRSSTARRVVCAMRCRS